MELTYRGIKYQYAPVTVEVTATEVCGKYRGAEYSCYHSPHTPITHNAVKLKYRGAVYYSGNPEDIEKLKQRNKLNFIFDSSNNLFPRNKPQNYRFSQTHSINLCCDLQRRLQVAKERGDENLIRILEDEAEQLSINDCQLSFHYP